MVSLSVCATAPLSGAALLEGFCAGELAALSASLQSPRSIIALSATDLILLERGTGSVVMAEDLDGDDGLAESVRTLVTTPLDGNEDEHPLNHGLAVTTTHLYASSDINVYRWPYDPISRNVTEDTPQLVIDNMNADGNGGAPEGHRTRTLAMDEAANLLYVSVGSYGNIDENSFRSRIRVFSLADERLFPMDFQSGDVFVDGLRNEVAMEFRPQDGVLWGAGNSADRLSRTDLGGESIFNDNPAEELHRLLPGQNYGYPYCFREYELDEGLGRGTTWAWPTFLDEGVITDPQCRNDFDAPVLAMQAHSAPLGITFYQYQDARPAECEGVAPFPESMDGDAFLAFHGSWNRDIPTGYKVVHVLITEDGTGVVGGIGADPIDLLKHEGDDAKWEDGFRPVDVSFDACGRLLVSSDGTRRDGVVVGDKIVRIERLPGLDTPSPTKSPSVMAENPVAAAPSPSSSGSPAGTRGRGSTALFGSTIGVIGLLLSFNG